MSDLLMNNVVSLIVTLSQKIRMIDDAIYFILPHFIFH